MSDPQDHAASITLAAQRLACSTVDQIAAVVGVSDWSLDEPEQVVRYCHAMLECVVCELVTAQAEEAPTPQWAAQWIEGIVRRMVDGTAEATGGGLTVTIVRRDAGSSSSEVEHDDA